MTFSFSQMMRNLKPVLTDWPRCTRAAAWLKRVVFTFLDTHCSMHAAGLTYYSMLALVPMLCLLLVLAKTLGADQLAKERLHARFEGQIEQFEQSTGLENASGPGAETGEPGSETVTAAENKRVEATRDFIRQARGIEAGLMERIDRFEVGRLGWIGFLLLIWTVIGTIGMVEVSFNEIWAVRRQRSYWRRMVLWAGVALALPILSTLAVSVPLLKLAKDIVEKTMGSLWLTRWVSDGTICLLDSGIFRLSVSLFFSMLTFGFLFKVLPNCPVRTRPALVCGLVTSVLFNGWFRLCTIAQIGIANTSAVYGSFAFLPIVLAWLYMSWQIVLFGCCMVRESSTPR